MSRKYSINSTVQCVDFCPVYSFYSYFDRDVECVRSFFNKRFRFQSDRFPRFRDIVPEDRQQMREIRAKRRARKAKEVGDGEYVESLEDEKLGLELDVLGDASGLGSVKKQVTALEQVSREGIGRA